MHPKKYLKIFPTKKNSGIEISNPKTRSIIPITIKSTVQYRKWSPGRKWSPKWSSNDPRSQMIPRWKSEWPGIKLLDHPVRFIITKKNKVLIKLNTFKKSQDWNKREAVKLHLKLSSINKTQINANKKKNLNTISKTIALEQQCSVSCLIVG